MTQNKNNNQSNPAKKPVVLCFSGHDPSGGAGIQADIEAISAQGVHAATVITALTCQDTHRVHDFQPVNAKNLQQQAEVILNDLDVKAVKIGMTADSEVVKVIHNIIQQHPKIPVIFDPVLAAGAGDSLSSETLIDSIKRYLLPYCQLITPNIPEAIKLAGISETDDNSIATAADHLLGLSSEYVLVTGTHADSDAIEHQLYHKHKPMQSFRNERLPHEYHGSGCTLASSIAAFIAKGESIPHAVEQGLDYTFSTLENAHNPGQGQWLPNRLYKLDDND